MSLFETFLVVDGRPLLATEHHLRLSRSCELLGYPVPARESLDAFVRETARKMAGESALRCRWSAADDGEWRLEGEAFHIPPATLSRRLHGRVLVLDSNWRRSRPEHKSIPEYAVCRAALEDATRRDADEALFTSSDGKILEGTSTNVFAVCGSTIFTPPLDAGILPGVMRDWVVRNAGRAGVAIEERLLTRDDLLRGSFLTGSLTTLAAIRSVDETPASAPGSAFDRLSVLFRSEMTSGGLFSAAKESR